MTKARVWKNRVSVVCPACKEIEVNNGFDADGDIAGVHEVPFIGASVAWQFNNDLERPTLSPSLHVKSGHFVSQHKEGDACWCTYRAEHPDEQGIPECRVCHSFIRDGRIEFLHDCTHSLAGQTVDLPECEV